MRRLLDGCGRVAGWLLLPLIGVIVFDVVTRRFFVLGSTRLQELEWHLHTLVFCLAMGFVLARDGHVRIELLRERFGARTRAWIELLGTLLLLLPFAGIALYYGADFALASYLQGERSPAPAGLPYRWLIKAAIPLGLLLLLLAGAIVAARSLAVLRGRGHRP